ncbi:MAG: DUF58 domain-containing protein [Ignavibacteriae bacterium]|nr:DUF58 domain-containing protein [Ignavibacteriota bacterium]
MEFLRSFYLSRRFFAVVAALVAGFILAQLLSALLAPMQTAVLLLSVLAALDALLLFLPRGSVKATRLVPEKLSIGDPNSITITIVNNYRYGLSGIVIDEVPAVFQIRDFRLPFSLASGKSIALTYTLRPLQRGDYVFGAVNVFGSTPLGLVRRRYRFDQEAHCLVYPSIVQMRKYELFAISDRLTEAGVKKIRRLGHTFEFDHIRNYVRGDDHRSINWKATARRQKVMVNQFQDEKAQQVFSVLDMGRSMKMPFNGLSLLDYAINASLVISNIAIHKHDKAGLITFAQDVQSMLPASSQYGQMHRILHTLYMQHTHFLESDIERLCAVISHQVKQRSLLLLFTNAETLVGMQRRMIALKRLNRSHTLVVIMFENSELSAMVEQHAKNAEQVYAKMVAEKLMHEKRQIVKELHLHGIQSMLVAPDQLTIETINMYLELKARGLA